MVFGVCHQGSHIHTNLDGSVRVTSRMEHTSTEYIRSLMLTRVGIDLSSLFQEAALSAEMQHRELMARWCHKLNLLDISFDSTLLHGAALNLCCKRPVALCVLYKLFLNIVLNIASPSSQSRKQCAGRWTRRTSATGDMWEKQTDNGEEGKNETCGERTMKMRSRGDRDGQRHEESDAPSNNSSTLSCTGL